MPVALQERLNKLGLPFHTGLGMICLTCQRAVLILIAASLHTLPHSGLEQGDCEFAFLLGSRTV